MKKSLPVLIALATLFTQTIFAQQTVRLDSTFNSVGYNDTPIGSDNNQAFAVAIQPDGKIVAAGYMDDGNSENLAVVRYNPDGTFDNTFGVAGIYIQLISDGSVINSIAIQPDGKIVAAGSVNNSGTDRDFLLIRLNANGTLDNSFGNNGIMMNDIDSNDDEIVAIKIQADGKIVAVGSAFVSPPFYNIFAITRYNVDGTLDSTFGTGGKLTTQAGNYNCRALAVLIQPDGKIIVGGSSTTQLSHAEDFTLIRYNTDGTIDNSFNTTGISITDIDGYYEEILSLALQPDGKIIATGVANNDSDNDFAVARYKPDGSLDSTFAADGIETTDFSNDSEVACSVILQPDGKIVASGFMDTDTNDVFALFRYNNDGSHDTTFTSDGLVNTDINGDYDHIYASALQPDGKIVVAGTTYDGTHYNFVVARYLTGTGLNVGILDFTSPVTSLLIYPNPFYETTKLEYELVNTENISVQIIDVTGRIVKTILENKNQQAGKHAIDIQLGNNVAVGSYILRISSGSGEVSIKMVKE